MSNDKTAKAPVLTVDGPSGSGKGTISQILATKLGYHLLDSGALYRLTALSVIKNDIDITDVDAVSKAALELDVVFEPQDNSGQK